MSAYASPTAYRRQSILTATPARLVVMLYDGCNRFLLQAAQAMRDGDRTRSEERLRRAEAIIDELRVTLDHERGGEIAARLGGIYTFCRTHLMHARRDQDDAAVEKVAELLGELRQSWEQLARA